MAISVENHKISPPPCIKGVPVEFCNGLKTRTRRLCWRRSSVRYGDAEKAPIWVNLNQQDHATTIDLSQMSSRSVDIWENGGRKPVFDSQ